MKARSVISWRREAIIYIYICILARAPFFAKVLALSRPVEDEENASDVHRNFDHTTEYDWSFDAAN